VIPGVAEWVRTLIVLALLATVMDWLLPQGDLKRYATLVAGLIILLALIGPVWGLVQNVGRIGSSRWLATPTPGHLHQLVARQERQEVAAVVESLPGVESVAVKQVGGRVRVDIRGFSGVSLPPEVSEAATAAVEEVMQVPGRQVTVVVQSRARVQTGTIGVNRGHGL